MQLVAYGAQDVYLTGSPQITFFKVVYRRHTNFSVEPIPQTFNGAADFARIVTCTINRNGDLITNMYINATIAADKTPAKSYGYVRRVGLAIIHHYKIEIGGSKIDEQYGDWLNIWYELTHKTGQERGFAKLVGDVPELTTISKAAKPEYQLYIPLQFWFNRNNGLALPLIALQYHDVRVSIEFRSAKDCVNYLSSDGDPDVKLRDAQLIIDYVYLDSEERKRFAQASHEYLIEQLQFTGSESLPSLNNKYRLNFNHPSKYLVWASHLEQYNSPNQWVSYATDGDWVKAKDNFAKIVWLATRTGLALVNGVYTVQDSSGADAGGEVIDPGVAAWANETLVSSKVKAQLIFSDTQLPAYDPPAIVDNLVLLSNNFTIADMSNTADVLADLFKATGETVPAIVKQFLTAQSVTVIDYFNYGNFIDRTDNPVATSKLQLNGSDRFQERDGYYFNYVQPWQHFSNTPSDGINVYSFSLKPEDHQPSGSCNFSRIDNATLNVSIGLGNSVGDSNYLANYVGGNNSSSSLNIYTVNYNVLRVMSGMAGVAYSN